MWKWIIGVVFLILLVAAGGGIYLYQSGTIKSIMDKMNPEAGGMKVRLEKVERGEKMVIRLLTVARDYMRAYQVVLTAR